MGSTIFFIVVITSLPCAILIAPFIRALQTEAPDVWASFGKPAIGMYLWQKSVLMPYSSLILFVDTGRCSPRPRERGLGPVGYLSPTGSRFLQLRRG